MSRSISARLDEKEIELLNEIAKQERIDRPALIRKFVLQQIEDYQLKHMAEFYRQGVMSLAEAATAAHVSIYVMMGYCKRENIQASDEPDEKLEREFVRGHAMYTEMRKNEQNQRNNHSETENKSGSEEHSPSKNPAKANEESKSRKKQKRKLSVTESPPPI